MRAPSDIIYHLLLALGHGTDPTGEDTWPIFVGFLPDAPDEALCVYDTAGRQDGRLMSDGTQIIHPGIQIRVRGKIYLDTYDKIRDIALDLDAQADTVVTIAAGEDYIVQNVSRTGDIIPLGVEEIDGRRTHHFTLNAVITLNEE